MKNFKNAQLIRHGGTYESGFNSYYIEYTIDNHFYYERFNFEEELNARLEQIEKTN